MRRFDRANLILGCGTVVLAVVVAALWVPLDSGSGLIERVRRQVTIGDGLAPTVAAVFLAIGGAMVAGLERPETARRLSRENAGFVAVLLAVLITSVLVMRWAGPMAVAILTEGEYRPLRATAPWKYIGFVIGGTAMVAGLIALVERRLTGRAVLIGVAATMALIVVYDLPFDDLLLPPNGDV